MLACDLMSDSTFTLSTLDRALVTLTQGGLPLTSKPYHNLGLQLNISADEVQIRLQRLLEAGVIRRIAAVPNHYQLGFRANGMTVWDVPDEHVQALGQQIGQLDFVSHSYHRPRHLPDWRYNLFAMVHGHNKDDVSDHINEIARILGPHNRANDVLFSTRILKKTGLRIKG